jgi:transcriptional regulator with XRE-family HTH domain
MSETIRKLRITFSDTQEQFARRLGVSSVTVARYETNFPPSAKILKRLSDLAEQNHLEEYKRIFSGDESGASELKKREFIAALTCLKQAMENVTEDRFRTIRAATALFYSYSIDLDKIEKLLGVSLLAADDLIQSSASLLDIEEAFSQHRRVNEAELERRKKSHQ